MHERILVVTSPADEPFNFYLKKKKREKMTKFCLAVASAYSKPPPGGGHVGREHEFAISFRDVLHIWKLCLSVSVVF